MLNKTQTALATTKALEFIAEHPLKSEQELREYMHGLIGGEEAHWADATAVILQEEVVTARKAAFEAASKGKADADADAAARKDAPVDVALVLPTTVTPVAELTYLNHTEAIKLAYYGDDPENRTFNLPAACKYAKLNSLSADVVADTVARPYSECHVAMYQG